MSVREAERGKSRGEQCGDRKDAEAGVKERLRNREYTGLR